MGTKLAVGICPAKRSGRSENAIVTGLTPCRVTRSRLLSKLTLRAFCTKRRSAFLGTGPPPAEVMPAGLPAGPEEAQLTSSRAARLVAKERQGVVFMGESVGFHEAWRFPSPFAGRQNRWRLGLRPVQAQDDVERTIGRRQPVGLFVGTRIIF